MRYKASFNSSSRHQVCRDSGIKRCLAPSSFEFTEFSFYNLLMKIRDVKIWINHIAHYKIIA